MSQVTLLAADRPFPLADRQVERESVSVVNGKEYKISFVRGFRVAEHSDYRESVDALGCAMKPYQYALELEACEEDLSALRTYLKEQLAAGEEVELWTLWVGVDQPGHVPHERRRLADFDMADLEKLCQPPHHNGLPGQCRMTITTSV